MADGKKAIIVHKFGGTSVLKEAPTILKIVLASIVAGESPAVVLSALAGVTNLLEAVFKDRHEPVLVEAHFMKIDELHHDWLRGLGLVEGLLDTQLAAMREGFRVAARAALSFQEQRDAVLAMGEPLSVAGFTFYFNAEAEGLKAEAVDTSECKPGRGYSYLLLNNSFGNASPRSTEDNANLRLRIRDVLEEGRVPIVTGFIGRSTTGRRSGSVATVGRGGSDLSACYFGALMEAVEVRIWSDVPGMLSADPRVVGKDRARPIPHLPFRHAMEMAGGGGKLHPRALVYAAKAGVPVRMLSTFEPSAPGTLITDGAELLPGLVGVVKLPNVVMINIHDPAMSATGGFVADITRVLARHGIVIGLIATGEVEVTMTVTDPSKRLEEALDEVRSEMDDDELKLDVTSEISLITVVHTCIDSSVEERIAHCMKRIGVEHLATSRGASRIAFQLPVLAAQADQVVRALHEELLKAA